MTELLTAAQMRAIETAAIASGAVTGLELMEHAGRGVVQAIFEEWPELAAGSFRAVVLCGPGGNGGDGFVVARLLKEWGWEVEVFLYGDPKRMPPDARMNYERWRGMGEVVPLDEKSIGWQGSPEILIDALFGIGLSRSLPNDLQRCLGILNGRFTSPDRRRLRRCVAIDVPSGLDADQGGVRAAFPGSILRSDLTVTFLTAKPGHYLGQGPILSGRLVVKPLGLLRERFFERGLFNDSSDDHPVVLNDHKLFGRETPFLRAQMSKHVGWHKYDLGHALILSGPSGRGGAARLAARGALRIGAGVVTVGCPTDAIPENAARLDAVMLTAVADAEGLAGVLEDKRINALCLGPGLGVERAAGLSGVALRRGISMVLDADALTALSRDAALFGALHAKCVLTPHAGEFARLFPDIAAKLGAPAATGPAYSKVDATREAAARAGCVVLFKGPDTVIADESGRCRINAAVYDRAAPWLATAGSGDVLAGFIAGLLARGFAPFDAACTGAWLHVECALSFGPGLIAEDLPEELPAVFRALGL